MSKSLLALAFEAGIRPFDPVAAQHSTDRQLGEIASVLLAGRNPYFDREYRERFGTKVHMIEISHSRLVMGAVESAQPAVGGDRHYRAVLFRCDGAVFYQSPDNRVLDRHAALVDLHYQASHIDEDKVLVDLCERQLKLAQRMIDSAERVLNSLHKQSPPANIVEG